MSDVFLVIAAIVSATAMGVLAWYAYQSHALSRRVADLTELTTKGSLFPLFHAQLENARDRTEKLVKLFAEVENARALSHLSQGLEIAYKEWTNDAFIQRVTGWVYTPEDVHGFVNLMSKAPQPYTIEHEQYKKGLIEPAKSFAESLRQLLREQLRLDDELLNRWFLGLKPMGDDAVMDNESNEDRNDQFFLMRFPKVLDSVLEFQRRQWHVTYLALAGIAALISLYGTDYCNNYSTLMLWLGFALAWWAVYVLGSLHGSTVNNRRSLLKMQEAYNESLPEDYKLNEKYGSQWRHFEISFALGFAVVIAACLCFGIVVYKLQVYWVILSFMAGFVLFSGGFRYHLPSKSIRKDVLITWRWLCDLFKKRGATEKEGDS